MSGQLLASRDPRRLRGMVERAAELSSEHGVGSVFVGIAAPEGDLLAPEFIDFVESALRVEDLLFRIMRERAVLLLTDVDREAAESVLGRLRDEFASRFSRPEPFEATLGFYEVPAGTSTVTAKRVLPTLFGRDEDEPDSDELS